MKQVIADLEQLRRRSRFLLIAQRLCVVIAVALGVLLAAVLVDYLLRLPAALRLIGLAAGVASLVVAGTRYLAPAFAFRPELTQLALRLERVVPALAGRLASSVEFAIAGLDERNALAARAVRETERRLSGVSLRRMASTRRMARDGLLCLALIILTAGLAWAAPRSAAIGAQRWLAPLGAAEWPARTAVASLMNDVLEHDGVHPRGVALPLRARNETPGKPGDRVEAHYRVITRASEGEDGDAGGEPAGPWETIALTHQGAGVHERLIDPRGDAVEVWFSTADDRTERERIDLVAPPAIESATLVVDPPAYAADHREPMRFSLGPGVDQRAITAAPALAGSTARMTIILNKPVPAPAEGASEAERTDWLRETFAPALHGSDENDDAAAAQSATPPAITDFFADGRTWRLSFALPAPVELGVSLADEHGLRNAEPIGYRIDVAPDAPPAVTLIEPAQDLAVLPNAVVEIVAEARDDVAIRSLELLATLERPRADADAAEAAPRGIDLGVGPARIDGQTATLEHTLDLAQLDLQPGDVITLRAVAEDVRPAEARTDADESDAEAAMDTAGARTIRIIAEEAFIQQARRQLSTIRQNAIRIEGMQADLQEEMENGEPAIDQARAQARIAERIAEQRDAVSDVAALLDQNRLEDETLADLTGQSRDLLEFAGRSAAEAADAIQRELADAESSEEEADAARQAIDDAQQAVRDELSDLIALLDRDEDAWLAERRLKEILDQQRTLADRTAELLPETLGQAPEELDDALRGRLNEAARGQRELSEEARQLVEELRRKGDAMEEVDRRTAATLRSAARTAEEQAVEEEMNRAAERLARNQLQSAQSGQEDVIAALEQMVDDLEESGQARAQELARQLASLVDSIRMLITFQEGELERFADAVDLGDFTGRDRAMIRLAQNTQAVAAEARQADPSVRRVARLLDRAADAQGSSIAALRTEPIDQDDAKAGMERSLELLIEARDLAEEMRQQAEQEQVQAERKQLVEAYRQLAERQVVLREETTPLAQMERLGRREIVEARRLGTRQNEIRLALEDLRARTEDIGEARIFDYVHDLLDRWCQRVADSLWDGAADVGTTDRQRMIAEGIVAQADAIEQAMMQQQDPFQRDQQNDQQQQAGGEQAGGQGPPPLIPPVTQLERLYSLQEQVNEHTIEIDQRDDLAEPARAERLRELGEMQRFIMSLADEMIRSMMPQQGGGEGGAPAPGGDGTGEDDGAMPRYRPANEDEQKMEAAP